MSLEDRVQQLEIQMAVMNTYWKITAACLSILVVGMIGLLIKFI